MKFTTTQPDFAANKAKIPQTVGYYAAFVALGLVSASLGPTLPGLARHTQSQLSQISFLFTARSLGYLLGSLQGGRLYDRVPGHPVMAAVLLVMAAMAALAPVVPFLWLLCIALLILGMGEGALDVGGNTLLVWVHGHSVGPFMNALHFFFGLGAFLSPIIVAQVILRSGDITWAYWLLALLVLPVAGWLLRLPSPTAQAAPVNDPAGEANGQRRNPSFLVLLLAAFFFLAVGAEGSFGGWVFTYAVALKLASEPVAAYLTSTFWGALMLGRLLSIPLAARFSPRSVLLADLVGCIASIGVILLCSGSLTATWLGAFGMGLFMASAFPTTISLAESRLRITGKITGWFFVGASAGGMFLPRVIGQLFEPVGPRVTMFAIGTDLLVAVGIYAALMLYSGQRPAAESR